MKTNQRGITLVALVITVIVLLILAGTAINIAVNGESIFGKASQAKNEWNSKVAEEESSVNSMLDLLEEASTGIKVVRGNPSDWDIDESAHSILGYTGGRTDVLVIPNQVGDVKITTIAEDFCRGGNMQGSITENVANAKTLVISEGITTIGGGAFAGCENFEGNLIIPKGLVTIGGGAFNGCSSFEGDLIIPNTVTTIYGGAFNNCSKLNGKLVIPSSVTTLQGGAFGRYKVY